MPFTGIAQTGIIPLSFLKLRNNYAFDNPAAAVLTESIDLKVINSSYTGLAGKVGLNYLDGSFTIKNRSANSAHVPGLLIHSEYETEILKRTRLLIRYSWNTKISENAKISAGIHAGFFNYSIKASSSSAGISAFVPDATIGLWLHSKSINIGLSSAQIFNSKIRPVNTIYSLNRYWTLNADYKIYSSPSSQLRAGTRIYSNGKESNGLTAALLLQLKDNFSTELNYSINKGVAFSLGLVQVPILSLKGDLFFSYFQSTGTKNLLNSNRIEINVRLYRKKFSTTDAN
jgi:hypothetical protein